ncbi:hypothetical protein EJB05_43206, partial [Eragrostis curvula]
MTKKAKQKYEPLQAICEIHHRKQHTFHNQDDDLMQRCTVTASRTGQEYKRKRKKKVWDYTECALGPIRCLSPMDPRFALVYIPQQVGQEKFGICFHEESVTSRLNAIKQTKHQPQDIQRNKI